MAIYNNREVAVMTPLKLEKKLPERVQIKDKQGQFWTVSTSELKFTKDEKKAMQVENNDKLDSIKEATPEDLEAVRAGVEPPSSPELKERAMQKAKHEDTVKLVQKNDEIAKAEAQKTLDAEKKATK
jgi:ethanolamine ammonia-lyase small subunit